MKLKRTYKKSIQLEVATGILLIISTVLALVIANSPYQNVYRHIFNEIYITQNFNLQMLVNDFFMAIFFLMAGLEIKHEILYGNLCSFKKASFPIISALGGVLVPALIFGIININSGYLGGIAIPISTDIAFAVGLFLMFRNKIDPTLKVFLLSLAVVDDLISIFAIGILYSSNVNNVYLIFAAIVFVLLLLANKVFKVNSATYYLISGMALWYFIYLSGVHSTISGVLLALTIPTTRYKTGCQTVLEKIQTKLTPINNLLILPLFAFANTGISLSMSGDFSDANPLALGIILGLTIGKPLGIMLFSSICVKLGITEKPQGSSWLSIFYVSLLAGVGFTMSIFIAELAFINNSYLINVSKICILIASSISVITTIVIIHFTQAAQNIHNLINKKVAKFY